MKKIALMLSFIMILSFTSCKSTEDKIANKVEEKAEKKVEKKVEKKSEEPEKKSAKELEKEKQKKKSEDNSKDTKTKNKDKKSNDKKIKRVVRKPKDKKENKEKNYTAQEKRALEIFEAEYGDWVKYIDDIHVDKYMQYDDFGAVLFTSEDFVDPYYEGYNIVAFYVDLAAEAVTDEFRVDVKYPVTKHDVVRFKNFDYPLVYFYVEGGLDYSGLLLASIYESSFYTIEWGVPENRPAYIAIDDGDGDGVYDYILEEQSGVDVFYLPVFDMKEAKQDVFYVSFASVEMGQYPSTPTDVIKQYLYGIKLRDIRFFDVDEVSGLDERLNEIFAEDAFDPGILLDYEILANTALEIEPMLVFEEDMLDKNTVDVYITVKGDYVDSNDIAGEDIGFVATLLKEDGKWKINAISSMY